MRGYISIYIIIIFILIIYIDMKLNEIKNKILIFISIAKWEIIRNLLFLKLYYYILVIKLISFFHLMFNFK